MAAYSVAMRERSQATYVVTHGSAATCKAIMPLPHPISTTRLGRHASTSATVSSTHSWVKGEG